MQNNSIAMVQTEAIIKRRRPIMADFLVASDYQPRAVNGSAVNFTLSWRSITSNPPLDFETGHHATAQTRHLIKRGANTVGSEGQQNQLSDCTTAS
jgi:hypothetical protein